MRQNASARDGTDPVRKAIESGGRRARVSGGNPMTQIDHPYDDDTEPTLTEERYAGFAMADTVVVFDTENESAWIRSDAAHDRSELC